jgi:hypothetical protein
MKGWDHNMGRKIFVILLVQYYFGTPRAAKLLSETGAW